ncbi:hypothetical protein M3J09_004586 [Ascochyta lentis]
MATTRRQNKRKEIAPEPAKSPPPKRPRQDSNTPCAFLTLPRELRDEIYKHLLESDNSTTLKPRNLIIKSGLIATNRQISDEFLDAILFHAPIIHTTVRNHNFAHIVTFLNRLSDAQLTRFKSADAVQQRQRKIRITLTYSRTKQSTRPQLNRWLDRFDDPKRRGAEIGVEYVLDWESWGNGGYKQRPQERVRAGVRSCEETRKMIAAMRGAGKMWF